MRIDKVFDPIAAVAPNVCSTNDQKAIWKAGRCLRPRGEWPFSIFTYRHLSNDITIFHGNCHRRAILFHVPSVSFIPFFVYGHFWQASKCECKTNLLFFFGVSRLLSQLWKLLELVRSSSDLRKGHFNLYGKFDFRSQ